MEKNSKGTYHNADIIPASCCNAHKEISRRKFIHVTGTSMIGSIAIPGLSWAAIASIRTDERNEIKRKKLIIKPVLTYSIPVRREKTSWRSWGGIQTEKDVEMERVRINDELKLLQLKADFPVDILPLSMLRKEADLAAAGDIDSADVYIIYAAGGKMEIFDALNKKGKNIIFFCRHRSGPVYLWYEIISPRFLRKHTDKLAVSGITEHDVVIDSQDEILWRLRALCGIKNTLNSKIIAIGSPGGWEQPKAPEYAVDKFKLDILTVSYEDLGKLLKEAFADMSALSLAKKRAAEYLNDGRLKLETKRVSVENCFLLEDVLKRIMGKYECNSITINDCMSTIMPLSETTACLSLTLLNDAGYLAFCESDFVVVPSGILLANISGKPVFLNDPTYPHDGIITLAHCTAPRRMDGKNLEPARLLTHFESDFGAAPKVEMRIGQTVTNIIPDFEFKRAVGFTGKITDNPFLDICRSQIDISFDFNSNQLAEKMPGFHWMTAYGDYIKECGYALRKIGIDLEVLA